MSLMLEGYDRREEGSFSRSVYTGESDLLLTVKRIVNPSSDQVITVMRESAGSPDTDTYLGRSLLGLPRRNLEELASGEGKTNDFITSFLKELTRVDDVAGRQAVRFLGGVFPRGYADQEDYDALMENPVGARAIFQGKFDLIDRSPLTLIEYLTALRPDIPASTAFLGYEPEDPGVSQLTYETFKDVLKGVSEQGPESVDLDEEFLVRATALVVLEQIQIHLKAREHGMTPVYIVQEEAGTH